MQNKNQKYDACIISNKYDRSFVKALESIIAQNIKPEWIYIIDDHSKENIEKSLEIKPPNISFTRNSSNSGRGFCRNLAHAFCQNDLLFSLDSTNIVDVDYVSKAIELINQPKVAAVYGRISNHKSLTSPKYQWRNRYLFNGDFDYGKKEVETEALSTYATLTRREDILAIGNFRKDLKHSEDAEIARRIITNQLKIIASPDLITYSTKEESILSMYERYWRWNHGYKKKVSIGEVYEITKLFTSVALKRHCRKLELRLALYCLLCPTFGYLIYRRKVS